MLLPPLTGSMTPTSASAVIPVVINRMHMAVALISVGTGTPIRDTAAMVETD
jgi:hypothetical protein